MVQFRRYDDVESFKYDTFDALMENEVRNNLLISMVTENKASCDAGWMMATITDKGHVILAALYAKPFNLFLYGPEREGHDAILLLAEEVRSIGLDLPGVLAECSLARCFADAYCANGESRRNLAMNIMRLDKLLEFKKAPGHNRPLEESDMIFVPYWEHAFSEECGAHVFTISENFDRISSRLGKGSHFIWEDGFPVSQAVHGRDTPNGAIINWVYTPPHLRGRGYATSVVAALSESLLERGKSFCCLFADADNPVSCEIYRNLGYYDICTLEDIRFDTRNKIS